MRSGRSSFLVHSLRLRIEGFGLDRLLTECITKGIRLRNVRTASDLEMTITVTEEDYQKLIKIVKSRYKITVLWERGGKPALRNLTAKKAAVVGFLLFAFLLYYQSLFISEIRVYGYESVSEMKIRQTLKDAGLFEGCRKDVDALALKQALYSNIGEIVWVGITCRGNLAEVTVVEGGEKIPALPDETPCHIVAERDGYIANIIPRQGLRAVTDGVYVKAGDLLITGIVPLAPTAYGTSAAGMTERYVHADGEVKAKVPYHVVFYQERYERIKAKSGSLLYGIQLGMGERKFDSTNFYNRFEACERTSRKVIKTMRPFPIEITFSKDEEVKLLQRERSEDEIRKLAEAQLRAYMKENLPEDVIILNKSLNFSLGENIIDISVVFEALQEIGKEQEIVFEQL